MYKICTVLVVSTCVGLGVLTQEKILHIYCVYSTYKTCVCLDLKMNPQLLYCLITLHSPHHYHLALFGTAHSSMYFSVVN